jgi:hypothetical protein
MLVFKDLLKEFMPITVIVTEPPTALLFPDFSESTETKFALLFSLNI